MTIQELCDTTRTSALILERASAVQSKRNQARLLYQLDELLGEFDEEIAVATDITRDEKAKIALVGRFCENVRASIVRKQSA
jgi:hypothetical protein